MSLLSTIKKDRMIANKEGNKKKYETLTTLLSEIQRLEKADQENDAKVQAVITKYVKGLNEMIALLGSDSTGLVDERANVEVYLPSQLSEEDLRYAIQFIIQDHA